MRAPSPAHRARAPSLGDEPWPIFPVPGLPFSRSRNCKNPLTPYDFESLMRRPGFALQEAPMSLSPKIAANATPVNVLTDVKTCTPAAPRCPDRLEIRPATPGLRWSHTKPRKRTRQGLGKSGYHFESATQYERITLNLLQ